MKFKLPSIGRIIRGLEAAIRRFPMAMLAAAVGTVIGLILLHLDESGIYPNVLLVLALAFPLFVAIVLLAEQKGWNRKQLWFCHLGALVFLGAYYLLLPNNIFEAEQFFIIRVFLWGIGFVLLLTFVPFLNKGEESAVKTFWHYNLNLIVSVALTAIWAGAIMAGISIAMGSVDFLFNIDIDGDRYAELWIVIVGIFSTVFFLSRLPKDVRQYANIEEYPKELRLFGQYVLVSLVALYFLILYAYVVKILVNWQWPEGQLAYMILGFSLLGILTYVALYPLWQTVSWIRKVGTAYYIALIPQVGMLFWALWFRISEYAITEKRYFVFIFGVWLLVMALYFLISKRKDIRIIPITLFLIALLSSFGPWGAFAVSERSQTNRLENLLVKNEILINNKVEKIDHEISIEDAREISATISYLNEVHGLDGIQPWFDQDFDSLEIASDKMDDLNLRIDGHRDLPSIIVEDLLGIDYIEFWEKPRFDDETFNLNANFSARGNLLNITEYDYFMQINSYFNEPASKRIEVEVVDGEIGEIDGELYTYGLFKGGEAILIKKNEEVIAEVGLSDMINSIFNEGLGFEVDQEDMTVNFINEEISLVFYFNHISGDIREDGYEVNSFDARLLFTLKP